MGYLMNFILDYFWPIFIIMVIFLIVMLVSCFRIFEKAKIDGYKVLIPFYNVYLFVKIADLPIFFVPILLIPMMNIFIFWYISFRIGDRFGKNIVFNLGMCLIPFVFYPILAFSNSLYKAAEERGVIRPQDQNSTLYNQFPDVVEVVQEDILEPFGTNDTIESVPLEEENFSTNGLIPPMELPVIPSTELKEVTSQEQMNSLEVIEHPSDEYLILDIEDDDTWHDQKQLSESEKTKKVVTIDPLKDDPLLNPDAQPIKIAHLDQYKVCKNCGARLDSDAEICFLCGKRIEIEE